MYELTVAEGSRYRLDEVNGLRISNITTGDDGEYTCRAEVDSEGRYDERKITVSVHSKASSLTHTHTPRCVVLRVASQSDSERSTE